MNVANLELCKELYELSGWGKSAFPYHIHDGLQKYFTYADGSNPPYIVRGTDYSLRAEEQNGEHVPAYDLGYVLRKLPSGVELYKRFRGNAWNISYFKDGSTRTSGKPTLLLSDNTPEDAACKLAIELFKQGILTKGSAPEGSGGDIG